MLDLASSLLFFSHSWLDLSAGWQRTYSIINRRPMTIRVTRYYLEPQHSHPRILQTSGFDRFLESEIILLFHASWEKWALDLSSSHTLYSHRYHLRYHQTFRSPLYSTETTTLKNKISLKCWQRKVIKGKGQKLQGNSVQYILMVIWCHCREKANLISTEVQFNNNLVWNTAQFKW